MTHGVTLHPTVSWKLEFSKIEDGGLPRFENIKPLYLYNGQGN